MSDDKIYDVPADWAKRAFVDDAKYKEMYAASINDPNKFWGEQAKRIDWIKPFTKVKNTSFAPGNISIKWFEDGTLNACFNCVDRHLAKRGDQTAIIWEGDDPKDDKKITYKELHAEVLQVRQRPEDAGRQERRPRHHLHADDPRGGLRDARLRAHRRGSLGDLRRLLAEFDRRPHRGLQIDVIVTADEGLRGGRKIPLKANVDAACEKAPVQDA